MLRKRKVLAVVLCAVMIAAMIPVFSAGAAEMTKPSVGDGSADSPYEIGTAAELLWFADRVSDGGRASICAVLTADIVINPGTFDVNGTYTSYAGESVIEWTPIGISSAYPYSGTFDGQNHSISGVYYNNSGVSSVGLFGYLSGATIKNVALVNSYIRGYDYVGGIAGNGGSSIINCFNSATVRAAGSYAGGIIGYLIGTVEKCGNSGVINAAKKYVGGVAGGGGGSSSQYSVINNSYNAGYVSGDDYVAGIAGYLNWYFRILNCYNTGTTEHGIYYRYYVNNGSFYFSYSNCYTLDSSVSNTSNSGTIKNATAFSSGAVAYLLQGSQSEEVWGQYIGYEDYPSIGGRKVYYNSTEDEYYNINGISLDTSSLTLGIGEGAALNATLTPSTAQASDISWSSSNVYVATVSSSGKVLGVAEGTALITAEAGEKKAYCVVTVGEASVDVVAVMLNKSSLSLTAGETAELTATVYPSDATDTSVRWSSSDESVATVSSSGKVSALSAGEAVITVTTVDGGFTAKCSVTVSASDEPNDYTINSLTGEIPEGGGSFYAEVNVTKNSDRDVIDIIVIALYKDGEMIDKTYMKANLSQWQTVTFGGKLTGVEGAVIKAFVWDGFDTMVPLGNTIEK